MRMQKWKDFLQKYKHAWVFSYFIIYLAWFIYLEKRTSVQYYPMHMHLDDVIPFCEYFVIPYLLWFAYIAVAILYFFFTSQKDFYKCCGMLFTGMTFCLIVYTFFPNEQELRPAVFAHSNIFTDLVQYIYDTDTSTNVCPSIHVLNSIGIFLSILECERLRKHKAVVTCSGILTLLICMSTVFLKQHSMVDVLCGAGLAIVLYAFVYRVNYQRLFATIQEWRRIQKEEATTIKRKNRSSRNEIG